MFEHVKPGDTIHRMLAGEGYMPLKCSEVTETLILAGPDGWSFDRRTGAEVDEGLGWGPPPKMTGSFLVLEKP